MKKLSLFIFIFSFSLCAAQKQGKDLVDSLLRWLPHEMQDTARVKLLSDICHLYINLNPDEGLKYGEQALELAKKIKWKKGIAYANGRIGTCYWARANNPKALEYMFSSLKTNEELKDSQAVSVNFSDIALVYWAQTDYASALQYFSKSLKLDEAAGNKKGMAYGYSSMGSVYGELNKYPDALENYLKALKIYEDAGDKYNAAPVLGNIGIIYGYLSDQSKALEYYFKSLATNREEGDKGAAANNLGSIGYSYLRIASEPGEQHLLKTLFAGSKTAALKQAKLYLDSSVTLKKEIFDLYGLEDTYKNLSRAEELAGNDKSALEYHKKYTEVKDSLYHSDDENKIVKLQMQYDFDKKEAAAKAALEKQKLVRNTIYSGLGVVVLFLIVLLIQRNKIAGERRKMALEQERMRISRDLHDDLGSELTGILMMSEQVTDASSSDTVKKNIEKIKDSSRRMVDQMGEIVWAMNSKNDTLDNLVGYLNMYTRNYFESSGIGTQVSVPETIPDIVMTGMKRRNIFLVVKESLNNIVKHAGASDINLSMNIEKNRMSIIVTDNGRGFELSQARAFGNGLKNMKSRMEDINGIYSIESGEEKGTKTMISFPLS